MSDQSDSAEDVPVFGAFNALLGYIGGQAATKAIFERLLWPQRHYSSIDLQTAPRLALLYPMGGPIGVTAIEVLDTVYKNGLLKGATQGHILGTHFYPDLGWTYKLHALGKEPERESQVRTCIWIHALLSLPLPAARGERAVTAAQEDEETAQVKTKETVKPVRSRQSVNHLTLAKATPEDLSNKQFPFISEEARAGMSSMLGICLTEATGTVIMICIAVIMRSIWSIIFIIPLVLRLLSAIFAVERETLADIPDTANIETHRDWEINCPAVEGMFILISGPPTVVNQFFRHYGHPIRNRFREVVQLILVILFATYFPVVLLCQVVSMPAVIQYVWTAWQVWIVLVMHLDRYTQKGVWRATTDAQIALTFSRGQEHLDDGNCCNDFTILFGQQRKGSAVVKATLSTTVVDSYGSGQKTLKSLIRK